MSLNELQTTVLTAKTGQNLRLFQELSAKYIFKAHANHLQHVYVHLTCNKLIYLYLNKI